MATNIITPQFIEMMRSSDYQGTSYAFAELIDNSFDAKADYVKLICIERRDADNRRYVDEILFCDNGTGMDDTTLNNCLTFAYGNDRSIEDIIANKKIGKFGMGLPNSSISQCKRVTVYSKSEDSEWRKKYMDINELLANDATELPDFTPEPLPGHYLEIDAIPNGDTGTIVSWCECDSLDRKYAPTLLKRAEGILGRLFRYHLANEKKIELIYYLYNASDRSYSLQQSTSVVLNDPLFLTPNAYISKVLWQNLERDLSIENPRRDPATYYQKFTEGLLENESRPTNEKLEDHSFRYEFKWQGQLYSFRFKTSHAHIDIQKPGTDKGGRTKVGQVYREKMNNGNIYFTRHGREISCGNYGFYSTTEEKERWWTIEIDFDANADALMGVSNTKQGIKFTKLDEHSGEEELFNEHTASLQQARDELWFKLTNKIKAGIKAAKRILREQAREWEQQVANEDAQEDSLIPTGTEKTTQAHLTTEGKRGGQFDRAQKADLQRTLEEKYPHLPSEDISRAIDKFDRSLVRGCILYTAMEESPQLWSQSLIRGFLVISVNTNHQFYDKIIAPFRNMRFESGLTAIELFISSLAWEESEHFNDGDKQRHLRDFRVFVGTHLNNYLEENDVTITEADFHSFAESFMETQEIETVDTEAN